MRSLVIRVAFVLACLAAPDAADLAPVRHATCLRFYSLEGEVKPEALRKAVAALGTKETEARVVLGPAAVSSRPKARFLALEVPAKTPAKDVQAALKKVCSHTDELAWTAFQGSERELPSIYGFSALECIVGMDNDLRWFDLSAGRARFFCLPGKLDAKDLRARFSRLYQPFNAGELGDLVHESIEWKLAEPLDAAAAKAAEKAIAKLPGVRKARIDVETHTLTAEIEHDGLRAAAPGSTAGGATGKEAEARLPGGGFLVDDVLGMLESTKIALESAAAGKEKR